MSNEPIDQNLANSVAMLEQILEVMPQDTDALKAVYTAYATGGQEERAFDYLIRLSEVVSGGGDPDALAFVLNEFPKYERKRGSEVAARVARLRLLGEESPSNSAPSSANPTEVAKTETVEVDISEELALAWRLYEENQLTQEEYSSVLHDLTEVSSKELEVPASVLHVLNDRGFTQMGRVMSHLSARSSVPFISLESFELNDRVAEALPPRFSAKDGALPFGFMDNDLLVAVLNPYNNTLVDQVETHSGHRCHTYLVEPDDYDAALSRLRKIVEAA